MRMDEIEWRYQGNSVRVGMTWHGQGLSVLMLPALSSISTRREMWPLQEHLGSRFTTLAIDWVGFGDRPRPPLRWSPEIYRSFLACLLNDVVPRPFATIAAGQASAKHQTADRGRCDFDVCFHFHFLPQCARAKRPGARAARYEM